MAIRFTPGGLQSYAPDSTPTSKFERAIEKSKGSSGGGGGGSRKKEIEDAKRAAEAAANTERARQEQELFEAKRIAEEARKAGDIKRLEDAAQKVFLKAQYLRDIKNKTSQEKVIIDTPPKNINEIELRKSEYKPTGNFNEVRTTRPNETYNPDIDAYIVKSEPSGQATGFIRQPTIEEKKTIDKAKFLGSQEGIQKGAYNILGEVTGMKYFGGKGYPFAGTAEKIVQIAEKTEPFIKPFILKGVKPEKRELVGKVLDYRPPIKRETVKEIIGTSFAFATLLPKTGVSQQQTYSEEIVEVIYKGKKVKMTLSQARSLGLTPMSRTQAVGEFSRLSEKEQIKIIKIAFKGRVYLDDASKLKDLQLATKFMKDAGLKDKQIVGVLKGVFVKQQQTSMTFVSNSAGGLVKTTTKQVAKQVTTQVASQTTTPLTSVFQGIQINQLSGSELFSPLLQLKKSKTKQKTLTMQDSGQNFISNVVIDTKERQTPRLFFSTKSDQSTRQDTNTDTKTGQLFVPDIKLRLDTPTIQKPKPGITQDFVQRFSNPPTPEPNKPRKPIVLPILKRGLTKPKSSSSLFSIFTRKGGKDIRVGSAKTESEAFGKLFQRLSSTLRASGFVESSTGEKIKPLSLREGFRLGKKSSFRIVEKKSRRLRKGSTGKEIQYFRKGSKGGKLF